MCHFLCRFRVPPVPTNFPLKVGEILILSFCIEQCKSQFHRSNNIELFAQLFTYSGLFRYNFISRALNIASVLKHLKRIENYLKYLDYINVHKNSKISISHFLLMHRVYSCTTKPPLKSRYCSQNLMNFKRNRSAPEMAPKLY